MFIIVEGPDGSGKSSLVNEIVNQASIKYPERKIVRFHMGKPEEESRAWVLNQWAASIEKTNWTDEHIVIADRWHWGEVTYAPLKRPHTCKDEYGLLGAGGWRLVELTLLSRGAVQFVLMQPPDVLARRVGVRGDDFVKVEELEQIHDLYLSGIAKSARAEVLTPDPDDMSALPALARRMLDAAKTREDQTKQIVQFEEYIGTWRPNVLLVGDKRNNQIGTPVLPFYPVNSNSGDFLLSSLPEPFWKTVGIVNGTEKCGPRLRMLWETLRKPRIVALGRMADKALRASGIGGEYFNTVPHPQYVRRFHHHDRYEYGLAIQRLSHETQGDDRWILR